MVSRILFTGFLLLASFSGLAASYDVHEPVNWQSFYEFEKQPNIVHERTLINTKPKRKVLLNRVESYDHVTKTASAVLDTTDNFGNPVSKRANVKINPAKFRAWGLSCLRLATVCAAAGALYTAYEVADWVWDLSDGQGDFLIDTPGETYSPSSDVCPGSLIKIKVDGVDVWHRKTNCFNVYSTYTTFETPYQTPAAVAWASPDQQVAVLGPSDLTVDGVTSIGKRTFYRYRRNAPAASIPPVSTATKVKPTPEQVLDTIGEDPRTWQIAPGVFPDIFDEVDLGDNPAQDGDLPTPEPEPDWVGDKPTDSDLLDPATAIPSSLKNVSSTFNHDSFLPAGCPPPFVVDIAGNQFSIDYQTVCNGAEMVRPFIVFSGMLLWLMIVYRGLQS